MTEGDKLKNEIDMNLSKTIIKLQESEQILLLTGQKESEAMKVLKELDTDIKNTLQDLNADDQDLELLSKHLSEVEAKVNLLSILAKEGI